MNLKKTIEVILKIERFILLILGIGATLVMFGNAAGRYIFHNTFVWAEEVIRMAFVWGMFIAITDAFLTNDHIGFRNLVDKTKVTQIAADIIYNIVLVAVGGILAFYGGLYNRLTGLVPLPGTNLPTALFQIPGVLAGWTWVGIGIIRILIITKESLFGNKKVTMNEDETK